MTAVSTNGQQHEQGAFGDDFTSPYVPIGVTARYPPPKNNIGGDPKQSWLKRAMPIVLAHKGIFISSLVISFIGLIFQVQIPNEVGQAIDDGLKKGGTPLSQFVIILVVLGLLRFVCNYFSRLLLLRTAYRIEYDLRNIVYEHLSRMSFSFYDRVQSGQLISRANSDIRAVQMYLSQAPFILVQCSVVLLAFADAVDQRPARVRRAVDHAVRLHRRREDAQGDVPGVMARSRLASPMSPPSSTRTSRVCAS